MLLAKGADASALVAAARLENLSFADTTMAVLYNLGFAPLFAQFAFFALAARTEAKDILVAPLSLPACFRFILSLS